MPQTKEAIKVTLPPGIPFGPPHVDKVKANYNLQPGVTEYGLWPFSTIEFAPDQKRFIARAMIENKKTKDIVAFNSSHEDYADAERAIALLTDSLNGVGERRIYNIFAETKEVHMSDHGGGNIVTVTEVTPLIWSMQEFKNA